MPPSLRWPRPSCAGRPLGCWWMVGHHDEVEPTHCPLLPRAPTTSRGVRRSATVTAQASASTTAGSSASSPPGADRAAAGAPRRVGGRWRRSFRWSFPPAIPGTTGRHQADDVPDLSSNNGTRYYLLDGCEPTHNWLVPDSTRWTRGCSSVGQSRRLITARSQVRGLPAPPSKASEPSPGNRLDCRPGHSLGHSPCRNTTGQERTQWTSGLT